MKMVCFCGEETQHVHGALYCDNPSCPEYMNIVQGTALITEPHEIEIDLPPERCINDNMPFHDYNCVYCAEMNQ